MYIKKLINIYICNTKRMSMPILDTDFFEKNFDIPVHKLDCTC